MRRIALLALLLLVVGLACKATPAPAQGPQLPATCSTEGYQHLESGEALVATIEGQDLAELWYEKGVLYITSGNQKNSTPLPDGVHFITFVLVDGETPIAQAQMEVNICLGEFYYREINITPFQTQDA